MNLFIIPLLAKEAHFKPFIMTCAILASQVELTVRKYFLQAISTTLQKIYALSLGKYHYAFNGKIPSFE